MGAIKKSNPLGLEARVYNAECDKYVIVEQ